MSAVPWLTRSQISVCSKKRAVSGPGNVSPPIQIYHADLGKTCTFRQLIDAAAQKTEVWLIIIGSSAA